MTHRHTLLVVSVAVAMLVAPTIMAGETATATRNTTNESGETAGMGAQVTAFTQSSSTALNDSVENGMWKAGFNQSNASERAQLVRNRTGTLEQRLDRLQRQNASLQERYENGSEPAYIAQQSRLSARIDSLQRAINDTDEAAAQAGVNDSRLERLRQNASELKGPETAAIARGLGGGPPADRGPPEDRGERGQSAGEGDRGAPENRTNGPDRTGGNAANETRGSGSSDGNSSAGGTDGENGGQGGSDNSDSRSAGGGQGGDDAPGRSAN